MLTRHRFPASPVQATRERLGRGRARAVVTVSGYALAGVGEEGRQLTREMCRVCAGELGVGEEEVLPAATGVIGLLPPEEPLLRAVAEAARRARAGERDFDSASRAITTTDTRPKVAARELPGGRVILGLAKGAGMIHPSLATMLCFLFTDAGIPLPEMGRSLKVAVERSFHGLSVDGDMSTNDTVLLLDSGEESPGGKADPSFSAALEEVCVSLARQLARDGEGATKLLEVEVEGAPSEEAAREMARRIVSSPLVKAAVWGADPNWGRILAALGSLPFSLREKELEICLGDLCLAREGKGVPFDEKKARELLEKEEVFFRLRVGRGPGRARAFGCDLTPEYVRINGSYRS
jgi:glutamate N-acetyltransferase/amino-acid N-acetyltransferase